MLSAECLIPTLYYPDSAGFEIDIRIPGKPAHKMKPKITSRGKFATMYNTKYTNEQTKIISKRMKESFEKMVANSEKYPGYSAKFTRLLHEPCSVSILAMYELAKSHHRKRKPVEMQMKTSKPDVDNITKIVLDAGNGILWKDDAQVVQCACAKYTAKQGEEPYMIIRVTW